MQEYESGVTCTSGPDETVIINPQPPELITSHCLCSHYSLALYMRRHTVQGSIMA